MKMLGKLANRFGQQGVARSQQNNMASLTKGARTSHALNPLPADEDPTPLDVKFWRGKPAIDYDKFQIDCSKYDMSKVIAKDAQGQWKHQSNNKVVEALKEHYDEKYTKVGAVHFINTGFTEGSQMNALRELCVQEDTMKYEGGANQRAPLEANVYDTGAPRQADIHYHHEMAYVGQSCKWVAFGAIAATDDPLKGATFISLNNPATEELMETKLGEKLKDKGVCYVRKLPDKKYFDDNDLDRSIVYNYWQTSFMTDDVEVAQERAAAKGLEVEWQHSPVFGRYMVTKYYVDCFEYDPWTDKNTMYASVADDYAWFDSWPGVKELPHWERPLKLTFGDDEVMTRDEKQQWVDHYDNNGVPILWKKGDLAICCNYRTAHGRPRYSLNEGEKRELGVFLGTTYKRQGALPGKW